MKLKSILISNFARFDKIPQRVSFVDGETLIVGENNDSGGSNSNGSGKSALLDAISWCLFGEVMKSVDVQEVIRRGESECSVALELEDADVVNKIIRSRGIKETLTYKVTDKRTDETTDYTRRTTTQTQEEILTHFGLDFKKYFADFANIVYFSSETVRGIASKQTSNAERIQFLTRFLNLSRFDLATKRAKELRDSNESSLQLVNSKINEITVNLDAQYSSFEEYEKFVSGQLIEMNTAKAEWTEYRSSQLEKKQTVVLIETLQAQLENLKEQKEQYDKSQKKLQELERDILNITESAKKSDKELGTFLSEEEYKKRLNKITTELEQIQADSSKRQAQIKDLEKQLATPLSCPKCKASLAYYDEELHPCDTSMVQKAKDALSLTVKTLAESIKAQRVKKNEIEDWQQKASMAQLQNRHIKDTLAYHIKSKEVLSLPEDTFSQQIANIESKIPTDVDIDQINADLKEAEEQLELINGELGRFREIKKNISKWISSLEEYRVEQNKYADVIAKHQFWITTFPQIKQAIIDNYLPIFETRTNYWLDFLNTGMTIRLLLEKELKTGGMKQQFQIRVIDEHGTDGPYDACSQGEMRRIAVCIAMAIRDIASSRNSLCFDFLMADEIVDGLDETGMNEFFKLLRNIKGQKLVISHNDDLKALFNNVIRVVRNNGISYIKTAA